MLAIMRPEIEQMTPKTDISIDDDRPSPLSGWSISAQTKRCQGEQSHHPDDPVVEPLVSNVIAAYIHQHRAPACTTVVASQAGLPPYCLAFEV